MRRLLAAAALAAMTAAAQDAAAQDVARWGPVAENVGTGTAICANDATVVCAVVLCREGALSFGLIGVAPEGAEEPVEVAIEVDDETFRREMTGVLINDEVVHLGTSIEVGDSLWTRMRAGSVVRIADRAEEDAREFSLRGSAVELDRVAAGCR